MNIIFHHRTRGLGAEGVHITGIFDAFKELDHNPTMLSFPGANPDIDAADSPSKAQIKSSGFNPLKKAANFTRKLPQALFELCEIGYNLIAIPRLARTAKEQACDLVYERYSMFMLAGVILKKLTGVKVIIEVNDSALVHRVRPLKLKRTARMIEKYVFNNVDGIVFISNYFRDLAAKEYGEQIMLKSCVSPNGVNLKHFQPEKDVREKIKQEIGLCNKTVIGYVGAFVHWHGIDWFVKEIAPQLKNNPDIVLLLVGDGVAYDDIEQCAKNEKVESQVILTGRLPHKKVARYIQAMDVGILPDSNMYGSPMKLFEFMAMGVGMLAPNFSPITEVVTDNHTGWLFEANDHQACIKRVLELSSDKEALAIIGNNAREYIIRERQWKHNASMIFSLLDKDDMSNLSEQEV